MSHDEDIYLKSLIILSFFGMFFLFLIYIYSPPVGTPFKIVFIFIFLFICFLGILAAIYPSQCLRILKIETVKEYRCQDKSLENMGHHPNCGKFHDHTFKYHGKKYCVGCTGLVTGAILAILTSIMYMIYGTVGLFFYLGVLMVLFSLLQITFLKIGNRMVRFLSNMGLVWGSSLILIGLLSKGNIFEIIYFMFMICIWIITRSELSKRNHDTICRECESNTLKFEHEI